MVLLEGIVIYILAAYIFFTIAPPIILNLIWYKRLKSGKSKLFGPLGVVSVIVTVGCLCNVPRCVTMIGEYFGWIR